jgi:hypothetical protein
VHRDGADGPASAPCRSGVRSALPAPSRCDPEHRGTAVRPARRATRDSPGSQQTSPTPGEAPRAKYEGLEGGTTRLGETLAADRLQRARLARPRPRAR